jgi:pyridoxamine 5'-phosphate oxidase
MNNETLQSLRQNYKMFTLDISDVNPNPIVQFQKWLTQALSSSLPEPNAFNLATVGADLTPNVRTVLLKGIDTGFIFYTNYQSLKGQDMAHSPHVAAHFLWLELERQVRIKGIVEKLTDNENDAYFYSRPLESRVGAIASDQSQPLAHREKLVEKFQSLMELEESALKRPLHWGGYRIIPTYVEFWQGRTGRLHDRVAYQLVNNDWSIFSLQP